jgi:high affinity Mn2+ porin
MDNGAWDYAADTRGYTWGLMVELNQPDWSIRVASVLVPTVANGIDFDTNIGQARGDNLELEYRYALARRPGKARFVAYANRAHMGSYGESLTLSPIKPDITQTRDYRTKYGLGINLEQELTDELGLFSRLGWNDGTTETWAFTEIDRTVSLGAALRGVAWKRPDDVAGLALILNGLSGPHAAYLAAGGYGFIIGDGALSYALEEIVETYYSAQLLKQLSASLDFQWVNHPAYNEARGSVGIFAGRVHLEF